VPAAVPGKKDRRNPVQFAGDERIGRFTERGVETDFLEIGESLHFIKAAAADDADCRLRHEKPPKIRFKVKGSRFKA
jgi:hypothetical protein